MSLRRQSRPHKKHGARPKTLCWARLKNQRNASKKMQRLWRKAWTPRIDSSVYFQMIFSPTNKLYWFLFMFFNLGIYFHLFSSSEIEQLCSFMCQMIVSTTNKLCWFPFFSFNLGIYFSFVFISWNWAAVLFHLPDVKLDYIRFMC